MSARLSDVTIVITAGHRPGCLREALLGLWTYLPECKIVVVSDDGDAAPFEKIPNVIWKQVPHDSFLTVKRNRGFELVDTEYAFNGSDDFAYNVDFRATLIRMLRIAEKTGAGVVGGSFKGRRYEGKLILGSDYIREIQLDTEREVPYAVHNSTSVWRVDLTANVTLIRTSVAQQIPWDERIGPVGGEHADWFLDLKDRKILVLWSPGLNVYEQLMAQGYPEYQAMRNRAHLGHELFLKKRGIKRYIRFGESF